MDHLTTFIRTEILSQYESIKAFSNAAGLSYRVVTNALYRGISNTQYSVVNSICEALGLTQIYGDGIVLASPAVRELLIKLDTLDGYGKSLVLGALDLESDRNRDRQLPEDQSGRLRILREPFGKVEGCPVPS